MNRIYRLVFSLTILTAFTACTFTDNVEQTASFLEINTVNVVAGNATQGPITADITDVWVSLDGDLLGVFPLPAIIPLLPAAQTSSIQVTAGIRNNGSVNNPIIYPFLQPITLTETLVPGETIERELTFSYFDNLEIPILETFETSTIFTSDIDDDPVTMLELSNECARNGVSSGLLKMTTANPAIGITSDFSFDPVAIDNNIAYLEMDYKNDINFFVGVLKEENGNVVPEFKIELFPKDDWNKIYIDLSNELSSEQLVSYRLIFVSEIIENAQDSAKIFLDNLKMIHR